MVYFSSALLGYLLGCINVAYLLVVSRGLEMESVGNGNPGASNIALNFGLKWSVVVAVCDIAKAILAGILAKVLFPEAVCVTAVASCAAVMGHMFPFYMRFKGGKGFASFIGMSFVVDWRVALIALTFGVMLAFVLDYIVAATFSVTCLVPAGVMLMNSAAPYGFIMGFIMYVSTAIILFKHRVNVRAIAAGTEPHLSDVWRKPAKKK